MPCPGVPPRHFNAGLSSLIVGPLQQTGEVETNILVIQPEAREKERKKGRKQEEHILTIPQ
jgi:hypothetical protein